ncbi:MAG: HEAT repeat domain-containing protein [Gemmatimonadota bacterium]|nr:MAG: HEAT repeat domain-containing protein [Gemmatimonadota bacterium]
MEEILAQDKEKFERTRDLVLLFHKTFNTMRVFTPDHPSWRKFQGDLAHKFEDYLDTHGQLAIDVEESRMLFQGLPVYDEKTKRHSLTFMLYTDGVREIIFDAGLSPDELKEIIDTFIENSRIPEEEQDIVCLLWEKNFPHFQYVTVDDLPDAETVALMSEIKKDTSQDEALPPQIVLSPEDQDRFESEKQSTMQKSSRIAYLSEMREQFEQPGSRGEMEFHDLEATEALKELIEREYVFDPNQEMATFLLEILHKDEMGKKYDHYAHLSKNFFEKVLSLSQFTAASQFLKGLDDLADEIRSKSPDQAERIDTSLTEMSSRKNIESLVRTINEGVPFSPEEFYEFLLMLKPIAIDPLCDLLGRIGSQQITTYIYKGLERLAVGHEHLLAQKVRDVPPQVARGLLTVIGNIGDTRIVAYLKSHTLERDSKLRYDTIQTLRRIGGEESNKVFIELLRDHDPDIRIAASRSLDFSCALTAGGVVLEMVSQKNFKKRSFAEKKAMLEYLGASRLEESLPVLKRLLQRRAFYARQRNSDTRVSAALGLGKFGSEEAFDALREHVKTRDHRVRETCMNILRKAGALTTS